MVGLHCGQLRPRRADAVPHAARRAANYLGGRRHRARDAGTSDLRPGHYTFLVSARSPEGDWGEPPAALALEVQPFLWQTCWFQGGLALASLAAAACAARWLSHRRLRARLERLQRAQAVQHERERIARDMHDHLGASLTRLALLSASAGADPATTGEQKLRLEVGSAVRESARALEEIVWAVNPRNDTVQGLSDYLSLMVDECFGETPVRCRQDLPVQVARRTLSARVRHNIILLFREAFHNTLRHARATEARLAFRSAGDRLEIDWTDNGRGFDLEAPRALEADGLENMRARAAELRARLEFQSAPGQGAAVRFALRLPPDGPEPEPTDAP